MQGPRASGDRPSLSVLLEMSLAQVFKGPWRSVTGRAQLGFPCGDWIGVLGQSRVFLGDCMPEVNRSGGWLCRFSG